MQYVLLVKPKSNYLIMCKESRVNVRIFEYSYKLFKFIFLMIFNIHA